jgi:hypothetical protein
VCINVCGQPDAAIQIDVASTCSGPPDCAGPQPAVDALVEGGGVDANQAHA